MPDAANNQSMIDLAREPDFDLGSIRVRPSLLQVDLEAGQQTLEPKIMQVLTALARRRGEVVTRDELNEACWGGRVVGEDALSRCISKVRRLGETANAFTLETVPRVGYRLLVANASPVEPGPSLDAAPALPAAVAPLPVIAGADRPSLAVMPFTFRAGFAQDEDLAYGMVEDIISAISLSPDMRVLASSSTLLHAGRGVDPRVVGRDLGVRYLLEGNVRRAEPNLRVTVQLIEATSAAVLWTQKFDRPLTELAALQEDLVTEIAGRLGVRVQNLEFERALKKPGNITAYEALQRAQAAFMKLTLDRLPAAIADARRAVAIAPDYGAAHAVLAGLLAMQVMWTGSSNEALAKEALRHNEKALLLSPNDPIVLSNSAITLNRLNHPQEAVLHAQRAVELNPNIAFCQAVLATVYLRVGRNDDVIAGFDIEEKLAPGNWGLYVSHARRSLAHFQAGRIEQALESMERSFRLNPDFVLTLVLRTALCGLSERQNEARDAVRRLRALEPSTPVDVHAARLHKWGEATQVAPLLAAFRKVWNETPAAPDTRSS